MKAFRFHHWKQAGRLEDIPAPEPGPSETLILIGGAGACHSDLHVMHEWSPEAIPQLAGWSLPFTLGHENAGWIDGGETAGMEIGTPVVISPVWGCGKCRSCRAGADNHCDHPNPSGSGGLGRDGGMAEYMVVPVNAIVPLNSLEPADAAPLTDAGLTSYHAVKQCLTILTPDTAAVVIGGGVLPFSYNTLPRGCALMTVLGGSTGELAEVVALAEAGKVKPHIQRFSLEEADVVYKKLQANEIAGRAVLIP